MIHARSGFVQGALSFLVAVPFWPIFAPFLLARPRAAAPPAGRRDSDRDDLEARIAAGEERLIEALQSLDGVAEEVLTPEIERVRGLGRALQTMAQRASEMSALLATPELSRERAARMLADLEATAEPSDPRAASVRSRIANIDRLESMRARTIEALERTLLDVEEIGSRMALLRFADRPEEEVVRIVRDIATSVEGVSEGLAL
jgi:hypothetical protein